MNLIDTVERNDLSQQLLKKCKNNKQMKKAQKIKDKFFSQQHYLNPSNCMSRIFFGWISGLITYGSIFQINEKAIPLMTEKMKSEVQFANLQSQIQNQTKSKTEGLTLTKTIINTYKFFILVLFILVFIITGLGLYGPILTNQIINYVQQGGISQGIQQGMILFFTVLITLLVRLTCQSHMYYYFAILGYNLSNTLRLAIYSKALKHPLLSQKRHNVSNIINYSQVDCQRMTNLGFQMACLIVGPIQIIVGLYLTYIYIGISFLAGIGIIFILLFITFFITKIQSRINDQLLKAKDARVKVTQQILNIIRFIKINAFEKYFFRKLNSKRIQQLQLSKRLNLLRIVVIFTYWLSTPLILSITFATYTWLGNELTANTAFTTIMLFRLLQFSIRMFPNAISQIIQIWSSLKRIQNFLFSKQITSKSITYVSQQSSFAIKITNGTYYWGVEKKQQSNNKTKIDNHQSYQSIKDEISLNNDSIISDDFLQRSMLKQQQGQLYRTALYDINITIPKGEVTMVYGDIGSGKSSLLYAILNQMKAEQRSMVEIDGEISFAPQKPWIMSTTVRQNITFYKPFDRQKFDQVIYYASLEKDLELLVKGEETQIGEKGINLSGGQKARIALARALYSDKSIILLDDIISAVDVHVGQFIMKETILKYLKGKTVIMPTHAIQFAQYADRVIILSKGRVTVQGPFQEINKTTEFNEIYKTEKQKHTSKSQDQENSKQEIQTIQNLKLINSATKSIDTYKQNVCQTDQIIQQLIIPQEQQKGQVKMEVYISYIKLNGGLIFVVIVIFSMICWISLSTLANIEIQLWCNNPADSNYHFYMFLGLSISSSLFIFIRAYTLVISGIYQGATVHKRMIKSLLYASLNRFYNRVPIGRIVNRLTKDLRQLDQAIGYSVGNFIIDSFSLLGNLVICTYASTPFIIIPVLVIMFLCYQVKEYYMKSQRECVRIENITNSPIVSGFISVVSGVSVIRAFGYEQEFLQSQIDKININKRTRITREALQSWFSIRLSCLSLLINMSAIGFCLITQTDNSALAGLLLTYALTLNDDIVSVIFSFAYLQTKMVSVQRILNFTKIQSEEGYKEYMIEWHTKEEGYNRVIQKGEIQFKNMSVTYRQDLPRTLRNISLKIKAGDKIGIVGRTGAGKSTLINALLRILKPCEGHLLIDSVDITQYFLKDLRYAMTMIDQQPTLINASFRENLDPRNVFSDEQLNKTIEECNLSEIVRQKGGINAVISNDSLSVGERQLLCICRAFLKHSPIVLIDQATANIDLNNDSLIQKVIQNKFKSSTVLTIAHRLSTLKNSNRILVLEEGRVLQWGTPQELQQKEGGVYRKMCQQPNLKDYFA